MRLAARVLRDVGLRIWLNESVIENFASVQRSIEDGYGPWFLSHPIEGRTIGKTGLQPYA